MPDAMRPNPVGVRVLIVDDSPVARQVLRTVLESDTGIRVVGMAGSGREAVELTARLRPDLVTMDLVMPGMDGMEATQRIMARNPTPILFFSSFFGHEGFYSRHDALAAGALDIVEKPSQILDGQWHTTAGALVKKVKSLAQVTVVTHMHGNAAREERRDRPVAAKVRPATRVVAIGASTGGPRVLDEMLSSLPADYGAAVVVVQHMADGFMTGWLSALRQRCALPLKIAEDGDRLQSGRVLFAPPSSHVSVQSGGRIKLDDAERGAGLSLHRHHVCIDCAGLRIAKRRCPADRYGGRWCVGPARDPARRRHDDGSGRGQLRALACRARRSVLTPPNKSCRRRE